MNKACTKCSFRTILLFRQAEGGPDAPFTFLFRDPEGTEHTFDGVTTSGTAEEVDGRKHVEYLYHIQNCAWDRIQIQLAHTETADHEDPVSYTHLTLPTIA